MIIWISQFCFSKDWLFSLQNVRKYWETPTILDNLFILSNQQYKNPKRFNLQSTNWKKQQICKFEKPKQKNIFDFCLIDDN